MSDSDDWGISTADPRFQPRPAADHGISPAQLREKVEALEKRVQSMSAILDAFMLMLPDDAKAMVVRHENELRQAFEVQIEERARLDAALKRIEELERHWADLELPMKHFEKANEP